MEVFLSALPEEQDFLLPYFRWLASRPRAEGHGWSLDATGRKNFADICGPFTVAHWTDDAAREVRIVEIIRT